MKDKNALFLLQAIGEISEETIADAERSPCERSSSDRFAVLRRPAALAAAIILAAAVLISVIIVIAAHPTSGTAPTATADEAVQVIGMEKAVKAAMRTLGEAGISSTLSGARYIDDAEQPRYLVKLAAQDGIYDCEVDARSGVVTDITYNTAPTQTATAESKASDSIKDNGSGEMSRSEDAPAAEQPADSAAEDTAPDVPEPTVYNPRGITPLTERRDLSASAYDHIEEPEPTEPDVDPVMKSLMQRAWELDQEEMRKWYAEHPGASSHTATDDFGVVKKNTEPTLPGVNIWNP